MTIASMARRDFPKRQPTLLLYLALVVMSRLLPVRQVAWIVRVAAVCIIGGLSIWIYVVSRQITTHLGINMFTITPKTALTLRDGRVIHVSLFRVFSHVKLS